MTLFTRKTVEGGLYMYFWSTLLILLVILYYWNVLWAIESINRSKLYHCRMNHYIIIMFWYMLKSKRSLAFYILLIILCSMHYVFGNKVIYCKTDWGSLSFYVYFIIYVLINMLCRSVRFTLKEGIRHFDDIVIVQVVIFP